MIDLEDKNILLFELCPNNKKGYLTENEINEGNELIDKFMYLLDLLGYKITK
jgi:hypothetical protein